MFSKILVAIDKSAMGRQVFEQAVSLAKTMNATLLLLHALSPFDEEFPGIPYPGMDGIYPGMHHETMQIYSNQWRQYEQEGLTLLQSLAETAYVAGVATEFSQNVGDPGRTICEVARTWEADLIMVGRRGRSGLSEFFLGSVSNYVLHHAPCAVLTVQGQRSSPSERTPAAETATMR